MAVFCPAQSLTTTPAPSCVSERKVFLIVGVGNMDVSSYDKTRTYSTYGKSIEKLFMFVFFILTQLVQYL